MGRTSSEQDFAISKFKYHCRNAVPFALKLRKAYRHIFTSPSSASKEPRATRSGNARIHGMKQVTTPSIAYAATLVSLRTINSPTRH